MDVASIRPDSPPVAEVPGRVPAGPGRHRRRRRGFRHRGVLAIALLVVVLVAGAASALVAPEDPAPVTRADLVVVPILPVGGDLERGKQTVEGVRADVDEAARSGAAGIRVTADLSWLCEPGGCDTAPLEPVVDRAREQGLRVYLHVNSTPRWMDDRGTWYGPEGDDARRWAGMFGEMVAVFGTDVAGYEVWNEPNNPDFWRQGADPEAYADLLKASWTVAKEIDRDVQIIGGVLSNNDLGYMRALSAALADRGGNQENTFFYDQLGVHPYAGGPGEGYAPDRSAGSADVDTAYGPKDMTFLGLTRLREQVAQDEGIWRDVVIGEFGYNTTPGSWYHVAEPQRARYLTDALSLAAGWDWVTAFSFYGYYDRSVDGFSLEGTPSEEALERRTEELGG